MAVSNFPGEVLLGDESFKSHISLLMSKLPLAICSRCRFDSLVDLLHLFSYYLSFSLFETFLSADFPLLAFLFCDDFLDEIMF